MQDQIKTKYLNIILYKKEKKLINKYLIDYLTFNSFNSLNKLQIKNCIVNDEYFSDIKKKQE